MPLEASAFPDEVQVAFFIYEQISEKYEGMSGSYMGKNWAEADFIFNIHDIQQRTTVFYFMQMYDSLVIKKRAEEAKRRDKSNERKSAGGGKQFTHNIQG
jgi:hypothetical protein